MIYTHTNTHKQTESLYYSNVLITRESVSNHQKKIADSYRVGLLDVPAEPYPLDGLAAGKPTGSSCCSRRRCCWLLRCRRGGLDRAAAGHFLRGGRCSSRGGSGVDAGLDDGHVDVAVVRHVVEPTTAQSSVPLAAFDPLLADALDVLRRAEQLDSRGFQAQPVLVGVQADAVAGEVLAEVHHGQGDLAALGRGQAQETGRFAVEAHEVLDVGALRGMIIVGFSNG